MPELPEVETTVRQIRGKTSGLLIKDVWTDYGSPHYLGKRNIKDKKFFKEFRREVIGRKITGASRRGKHILIHLSDKTTILVHMKMTGHFLYGKYKKTKKSYAPDEKRQELHDPFNRFIHLVFSFSNGKHLVFSDMRKFATITFFKNGKDISTVLSLVGPEPLDGSFSFGKFKERLFLKPERMIKPALTDQTIIAGIGNIYSDEILFEAEVHPEERISKISAPKLKKMYKAMKKMLKYSISIGGDSMSDFRDLDGRRGGFQNKHKVYRKTGQNCPMPLCKGIICRQMVKGRSSHFCDNHQRLLRKK